MDANDARHGSNAGYCAHRDEGSDVCFPCRLAHCEYEGTRARLVAYGRWNPWVEAEPARQHVRDLMAAGMGIRVIAKAIGQPYGRVSHLLYGHKNQASGKPPAKIRPAYSEAILALEPTPRIVDATGARRRLGALIALGYPQTALGRELGCSQNRVWLLLHEAERIERTTHDAIAAMYDRLSMTLPNERTRGEKYAASKARNTAARNGFVPPLAWNNIDDPDETPAGIPTGHQRTTRPRAELLSEWDHLRAAGVTLERAATQLGVTPDAIEMAVYRNRQGAA